MPNSIALPMRYRELTGDPKDGGVLTTTDHLRESRCIWSVSAFSLTEPTGATHALAPDVGNRNSNEGMAHALASLLTDPYTNTGEIHALASRLIRPKIIDGAAHARPSLQSAPKGGRMPRMR